MVAVVARRIAASPAIIELACASNWQELLNQRQQRINDFTEGLGHTLRAGLHSDQRLPAIAAYDEERCNHVLDRLTDTIQVPTLRLNTVTHIQPFEQDDWPAAASALAPRVQGADLRFSDWAVIVMFSLVKGGRALAHFSLEEPDGAVAPPGRAALARQGFISWVVYIQVADPVGELSVSTNPLTGVRNARLFPARPARNHLGPIGAPGRKRFGHIGSIAGARTRTRFPPFMSEQACTHFSGRFFGFSRTNFVL